MSGIIHKVKEALHSDSSNTTHNTTGTHNTAEGNHGPHSSKVANAADPRVDSDRDGSHTVGNTGSHAHGTAGTYGNTGLTGTHGNTGNHGIGGTSGGPAPNTAGPHSSDMMNKADPRIDSDRDGSHNIGNQSHGNTGLTGTHGNTGNHGIGGTSGGPAPNTAGPHSSDMMNKADPRIESDRDGSHNIGNQSHGATGTYGTHNAGHGNHGAAGVGAAAAAGGIAGHHQGTHGSHARDGPAANTAGPHSSDMMNKADPRVDSDRDGSNTIGSGNTSGQGYQSTHFGGEHKQHSSEAFGGQYGMGHATTGVMPVGASGVGAAVAPGPNSYQVDRPPHKSDLLNKLDPRIDSDKHASGTHGTTGNHGVTGTHGNTGNHGITGTHGNQGTYDNTTGAHGTHGSNTLGESNQRQL